MATPLNIKESLEHAVTKAGSRLPRIPGGLGEAQTPHIVQQVDCICDRETQRACTLDKIFPKKPGCVRSNLL